MELLEIIKKRRSIRQYTEKAIPEEKLRKLLDPGTFKKSTGWTVYRRVFAEYLRISGRISDGRDFVTWDASGTSRRTFAGGNSGKQNTLRKIWKYYRR